MLGMKYISYEGPMHREIVLFPNSHDHRAFLQRLDIDPNDIIGAGFIDCDRYNPEPKCVGKSVSLNTIADPGDTQLLRRMLSW